MKCVNQDQNVIRFKISHNNTSGGVITNTHKHEEGDHTEEVDPTIHLLYQYGADINKKDRWELKPGHRLTEVSLPGTAWLHSTLLLWEATLKHWSS